MPIQLKSGLSHSVHSGVSFGLTIFSSRMPMRLLPSTRLSLPSGLNGSDETSMSVCREDQELTSDLLLDQKMRRKSFLTWLFTGGWLIRTCLLKSQSDYPPCSQHQYQLLHRLLCFRCIRSILVVEHVPPSEAPCAPLL